MTGGTYGAGDSFAGALTYYLAAGLDAAEAAAPAAHHGAAVVGSIDPLAAQLPLPALASPRTAIKIDSCRRGR